jgi:hypothetical protein
MPRSWFVLAGLLLMTGCLPTPADPPPAPPSPAPAAAPSAPPSEPAFTPEPGFERIAFADCAVFPADDTTTGTWTSSGDEILCTGKPKCYLHTKTPTGDGTLRFDYRFEPDPKVTDPAKLAAHNTGVLLFIQEPHAVWPKSIEVQGKHSEMGQLRPNGGAAAVEYADKPEVREAARKPVGDWNSIEIVTKAGAITASINGQVVAEGKPGELTSGLIGLQAEGHRLRYRRLRFSK